MPDLRISELPAVGAFAETDLHPIVQTISGTTLETRRASLAQLRGAMLADRGVHVRDYGAKGDGTTNDAPAIQAAINDLATRGGGVLHFGPRTYRLASAVSITNTMVVMQGAGFTEAPAAGQGTWLALDSPGFTPFTFSGVTARGSAVRDIAVQQVHTAALSPSWTPTAYPYVFRVEDCLGGVDFDNLLLANANRGIYARNSGRLDIRRLRGQVFTTAVEIDECLDVPRLHSIHLWTFWTADENVVRWGQANGDALVLRRCDGAFIDQVFALGYRSVFRFRPSAAGAPPERSGVTTKFAIGQAYVDFSRYGLWIDANGVDGQVGNITTHGEVFNGAGVPIAGSAGIQVDANNTRLHIANLRVDAVEDNAVRVNGSGNRLDIGAFRAVRYNTRNNGAAALHLADSGAAAPNVASLAAPPLLESGNAGPLTNLGSNALLQQQAGLVLRRQTTDATQTRLTADGAAPGSTNSLPLPNSGTFAVRIHALARQTGGSAGTAGDSAAWEVSALIRRGANAAATSLVAGGGGALAPGLNDAAAAAWRLAVAADTTNGGLAVSGTGEVNKAITWIARIASVEAAG